MTASSAQPPLGGPEAQPPEDKKAPSGDDVNPSRRPRKAQPPRRAQETAGDLLGRRALNRALLDRQLLLHRVELPAVQTVEHLVGLQAQNPGSPYVALWTRLEGFRPEALSQLIADRGAVRIALMRSTIHLVTARDCLALRPVLQPVQDRFLYGGTPYGRNLAGMDLEALVAAGRVLVEERPRTMAEIRTLLQERWPERDAASLAYAVRNLLPLVQVPPRGLWGKAGRPTLTTAESWLGRPLEPDPSPEVMVERYLGAFGPASVADLQTWSGLTRLREVVERLRPRLRPFRDELGRELFDLPDAPRPDPDTPVPVRFLPDYDNVLLSHADRTRIVDPLHRQRVLDDNPNEALGSFLVDGFAAGTWKIVRQRRAATLMVDPFERLSGRDAAAVGEEGARLLAFVSPGAESLDVRLNPPGAA
jgi:DNA glycosylase AlkZ-like